TGIAQSYEHHGNVILGTYGTELVFQSSRRHDPRREPSHAQNSIAPRVVIAHTDDLFHPVVICCPAVVQQRAKSRCVTVEMTGKDPMLVAWIAQRGRILSQSGL